MSQENVAEEVHHRKTKIEDVLREFKALDWEKAKAFCGNDQRILGLREDYFERKVEEAGDEEETIRALQEQMRSGLGPPPFISYKKGGVWVNEI